MSAHQAAPSACHSCGVVKPQTDYYKRSAKARGRDQGYERVCKDCAKARSVRNGRAWRQAHPGERLARFRRWKYGLSKEAFAALWRSQNAKCAICRAPFESEAAAHVDHSHETGDVRGLLCLTCNLGVGSMQDDPERLRAAAEYLTKPPGGRAVN